MSPLRDELVAQGKLIPKSDDLFEFAEDVEFSSPSAAPQWLQPHVGTGASLGRSPAGRPMRIGRSRKW
jgi:hypothetical protein